MIRRIAQCSTIAALLVSTTGCLGILNNLPIPIPGLGGQPSPSGEEIQLLYAKGVRAMMTIERAADAEVLETFVKRVLVRKLRPGEIVVQDDVGVRKVPNARRLIEATGASRLFLPLYFLDLNPVEPCWSKLKSILTDLGARTQQALDGAIRRAMDLIGSDDAVASFTHCGCGAQVKCSAL